MADDPASGYYCNHLHLGYPHSGVSIVGVAWYQLGTAKASQVLTDFNGHANVRWTLFTMVGRWDLQIQASREEIDDSDSFVPKYPAEDLPEHF